jgi:hydroxyacylglutathione hydrolase
MIFKPFHRDETGCAAYVFGCGGHGVEAAVDPRERDVEAYAAYAGSKGRPA